MAETPVQPSRGKIRNFLFNIVNKEFLVFLFFLAFSGIFWLLMTLNETYEKELTVEVRLVNIPRNVVMTSELTDVAKVTVRDKGYMISAYLTSSPLRPITLNFNNYADGKGHGVIPVSDITKQVYQQLYKSTKIVSVKAEHLEFTYNYGKHKKVPVRMNGTVLPGSSYYLANIHFEPDSVMVYASQQKLDSIHWVYIERQNIANITDTLITQVALRKTSGVKCMPGQVRMVIYPDILTEETVEVPIMAENMPDDKVLRTFPQKVVVKFVVGASRLRTMPKNPETKALLPNGFRLVVDYEEIANHPSEKCRLYLRATPSGIRNARPETTEVDYLIEQQ